MPETVNTLLAPRYLFRFAVPVKRRAPLWKPSGIELDESYSLLDLAELDAGTADRERHFADVRMAWGAEGLLLNIKVEGKQQPMWCRDGRLEDSDGLTVWVDTRAKDPILVVADRRNNRLQRFTMDGKHVDFVSGFRLPCHFDEHRGNVVVPDLQGRVTLIDKHNQAVAQLGDSNPPNGNPPLRREPREKFIPGQFICPHGACFDHDGNIFVVEWVEVGRVTKLV